MTAIMPAVVLRGTAFTTGALVMAAALAGCSSGSPQHAPAPAGTLVLHASWADGYPTLPEMRKHADIIVRGTVTGVAAHGMLEDQTPAIDQARIPKAPFTEFAFTVTSAVKGHVPSEPIIIRQTGGPTDTGQLAEVDDDPLLQVGSDDVLFLRQFSPGHYLIIGGPAGRFPVIDGHLVSVMPGTPLVARPPAEFSKFIAAVTS